MLITPAIWLFVVTGQSRDEVDETLCSDAARTFALNAPAELWASHGVEHPLGADFSGAQDFLPQTLDEETVLSYARRVPVSLMKDSVLNGTPEEVIEQAAEWRDNGLRYLVVAVRDALWDTAAIQCYADYVAKNIFTPAGVNGPLLQHSPGDALNVSMMQPSLRKSLATGAPFFKILRGLKKL